MSAIRISRSRSKFPFVDTQGFSASKPPRNRGHDVRRHTDAACSADGDTEERGDSRENAARAADPKGGILCQDHVRDTAWSMSGLSLKFGSTPEAWGLLNVRTALLYRRNDQAPSFSSILDGIPMCRHRPRRPTRRSGTRWRREATGLCQS